VAGVDDPPRKTAPDRADEPARPPAALSGVLATAVALGVAELVAGLLGGVGSLVVAVGDAVIDSVPGWLERAAISVLGTADKPVLIAGVLVVCALFGAGLGVVGRRRFPLAAAGVAGVAALGVAAALLDSRSSVPATVAVGAAGALAGVVTLRQLLRAAPRTPGVEPGDDGGHPAGEPVAPVRAGVGRRSFLALAAGATTVAALGAAGGRWLASSAAVEGIRSAIRIPRPSRPAPPVPAGADLEVPGLSPLFTPNADFYRIDTALVIPQIDPATWTLEVRGMVDRPFTLTYDELLSLDHIEADVTLACVSNEVGGDLVGNARWQGVPLRALLERAGVHDGADQVMGRSVDGFTAGFPTATALRTDDAMVAVAMNGEPLPALHGFPARLVVPGLYGYVSATKWLSVIELTTFRDEAGYWIPRGWAREGPIKTQSRIDVPRASTTVTPGRHAVAGVAWAPTRGIEGVEVRVDDGPWSAARLAEPVDVDCWRQWVYEWEATPGRHALTVRATDGTGETQTDERTSVAPDGASGHHTIEVVVGT
jgi:DMSO/TMAO reductase YedYZ molybdopterin-dependent catalytic subunit